MKRKTKPISLSLLVGGLLFIASSRPNQVFAMSDSASSVTAPSGNKTSTAAGTSGPQTDSTSLPGATSDSSSSPTQGSVTTNPTTPTASPTTATGTPTSTTDKGSMQPSSNSSIASGSSATQSDTSSIDSNTQKVSNSPSSGSTTGGQSSTQNSPKAQGQTTDAEGTTSQSSTNNTKVDNNIVGKSQTGNASVTYSPRGGDATSGNATDTATLINSSASSVSGAGVQTFTYNIDGNQSGNILLNLGSILGSLNNAVLPNKTSTSSTNNSTVNNKINLSALTGNATVANNGSGGNATTGNALTEADIINLLSSLISDNKSFVGTININGNLNGNILLPSNLIDSLLNPSAVQPTSSLGNNAAANNTAINNDVTLTAKSGTASVSNNGQAGNASSGNATTSLSTYNMVNNNIVGGNVLLVFVNVVGHWYGLLMNAPAGTNTAALGGSIQQDSVSPSAQMAAINNNTINNIVNLSSISGNASVLNNGKAGNATTGDATAIADIANIVNSQINLSGWLGVLVINVFGSWNGSLLTQQSSAPIVTVHSSPHHHSVVIGRGSGSGGNGISQWYNFGPDVSFSSYIAPSSGAPAIRAAAQVLGDSIGGTSQDVITTATTVPVASRVATVSPLSKKSGIKDLIISLVIVGLSALTIALSTVKITHKKTNK